MTKTALVLLAADYNNKGASFLEGENYKGTIVCFARGLQAWCKVAVTTSCPHDNNQSDSCIDLIVSKDVKSVASSDDVYMHPIRLPLPMYLNDHVDTGSIISSILIFNQALAYHRM
jgi:hypothetical protein